ncbi:transmembrane protein, putative (macronuclear) [Tetrahymena thermophila SB210]|uniref:Transmembrane protein, putative n=1 Tax=Tetrahymena thermophila (strain SB210) TaxID=312017 RepID=W7XDT3_TETTS|nr:transmembrane protein, putative [Tetrahymena thermophila SB210]EWS72021.1 transmembrane protein, putative [Tetrahymena thermophila SB210]|eukprot:XP_012655451.1 transmembrane protein, putative [Tetrahymena thermophila SB210]
MHMIILIKATFKRPLIFYIAIFTFKEISGFFHLIICCHLLCLFRPKIHSAFIHFNKNILIFQVYSVRSLENLFHFQVYHFKMLINIKKQSIYNTHINKQTIKTYVHINKTNKSLILINKNVNNQKSFLAKLDMILNQSSQRV